MRLGSNRSQFALWRTSPVLFLPACQGRLALTASSARYLREAADGQLEHVCQTAIDGRRAVRKLTRWSEPFELSESELQILSCLSRSIGLGVDQTTLAASLAFSPPQVSACVEKLRTRGMIAQREAPGDRRRRLWQLSAEGTAILQKVVSAAGESREAAA
jgi:DNA-binding MarR family transcriptional regulator